MTRFMIPITALTLLASQAIAAGETTTDTLADPETPRDEIYVFSVNTTTGEIKRIDKDGYVSGEDGVMLKEDPLTVDTYDEESELDVEAKPRLK